MSQSRVNQACAAIVERDDPHLYATALFAPEPARSRLMVLYAFDCELSRATRASKESLIPRMRLQWWRDMIEEAAAGKPPKAHEVAAPLSELVQNGGPVANLNALIDAHGLELELPWTPTQAEHWRDHRFQCLVASATQLMVGEDDPPPVIGPALSDAFALRSAHRMARDQSATLLPDLKGSDLAELARGKMTGHAREVAQQTATRGLDTLALARQQAHPSHRQMIPTLLPTFWAERTLTMVARDPEVIFGQLDHIDRPFDGLKLAWRAFRGRW